MRFITLMTDFGLQDGYNGVMQGVIYRIAPDVKIVDITHNIPPQDIRAASLVLNRSYPYFPDGTIHVIVVDPGVGTQRRPIAARLGSHFFVCPDNGLLTRAIVETEKAGGTVEIVHLDQPRFWLEQVSNVFHGRDIFAPAAAHLAYGVPLSELGSPVHDPVRLVVSEPTPLPNGWASEVTDVDHFGNLGTNIHPAHLASLKRPLIRIGGREIHGLVKTFGDRAPGSLVALIDSDDTMAIAIVQGNAVQELGVELGSPVEVVEES